MATEIERKFLVQGDAWRKDADTGRACRQGYLLAEKEKTVRVRIIGTEAFLTIKGAMQGISRAEFEYPIPVCDAEKLLALCGDAVIEKTRHRVSFAGNTWEVDLFHGRHAGLVLAEIELRSEGQTFEKPAWLGPEVSADPRYSNARLSLAEGVPD